MICWQEQVLQRSRQASIPILSRQNVRRLDFSLYYDTCSVSICRINQHHLIQPLIRHVNAPPVKSMSSPELLNTLLYNQPAELYARLDCKFVTFRGGTHHLSLCSTEVVSCSSFSSFLSYEKIPIPHLL